MILFFCTIFSITHTRDICKYFRLCQTSVYCSRFNTQTA